MADVVPGWAKLMVVCCDKKGTQSGSVGFRTVPGKSWECVWTLVLEKGQLLSRDRTTLAITGGTGEYAGAQSHRQRRQSYQFHLQNQVTANIWTLSQAMSLRRRPIPSSSRSGRHGEACLDDLRDVRFGSGT